MRLFLALLLTFTALAPTFAQRPGDPGDEGDTDVSVRYDQDDVDPGERARLEVIDTNDNIDYITRTYTLREANAADLFPIIDEAIDQENGRVDTLALGGDIRRNSETGDFEIEDAAESYMVITAPEWMFPGIDQTIATLDRGGLSAWRDGTVDAYFVLEHRRPSELAEFIEDYVTRRAILIPDDSTNRLFVRDAPENLRAIIQAIENFDAPAQAVMIEVEIIEIVRDDDRDLGVWWDAWKEALPTEIDAEYSFFTDAGRDADVDARVVEPTGVTGFISGVSPRYTRTNQHGVAVSLNNISPQAAADFVNYLINEGHARVLTSPRITVLQNGVGEIQSVTEYQTVNLLQQDEEGPRIFTDVTVGEGVELEVTPFIGTNTIQLAVHAEVNSLVGFGEGGLPIVTKREVESQAVLRDGERMTLAGLALEQIVKESSGIPVLRRIPLLRYLFSRETEVHRTSDIVIFLTPRIVEPGGYYAGAERDRLLREEAAEELTHLQ